MKEEKKRSLIFFFLKSFCYQEVFGAFFVCFAPMYFCSFESRKDLYLFAMPKHL